jgi:hypothetical protein
VLPVFSTKNVARKGSVPPTIVVGSPWLRLIPVYRLDTANMDENCAACGAWSDACVMASMIDMARKMIPGDPLSTSLKYSAPNGMVDIEPKAMTRQ